MSGRDDWSGILLDSFEKQLRLAARVGTAAWSFDLQEGRLSFSNSDCWKVQLLGTQSEATNTWLWSWANPSPLPKMLLGSARLLLMYGEEHGIPEMTEAQQSCADLDPEFITMIACGICRAQAYFRGPYDGGAAYFLIQDPSYPVPEQPLSQRIAIACPQALLTLPIHNHKRGLLDYFQCLELTVQINGDSLTTFENQVPILTARFDGLDRLIELTTLRD